jgi:type II restriction enzyme
MAGKSRALEIFERLVDEDLPSNPGKIVMSMGGVDFTLRQRDSVGALIQEWFGFWLDARGYQYTMPKNSQEFPDFILQDGELLEVKTFNTSAGPGFDLAAFGYYVESLETTPQRLDSSYLVFSYTLENGLLRVDKIYLKKIWEMTGPSEKNILNLQVKRGFPYNIRPKNFVQQSIDTFASRKEFLNHLDAAAKKFARPPSHDSSWIWRVQEAYEHDTGNKL